ncbi:glycosyltransferase [Kaistella sp. 97-N-M2]|uniref:glycosyltransferase n=1 Tax=Kaistella sp. 97-N-M2 TaxID=2908645 RepID=UPI001F1C9D16|nr:glycosyltransferase [Kaistella sp. 97-N-M2]UJF28773.1 glycosyltransferase [Kaistella sp. 97-N-M2]
MKKKLLFVIPSLAAGGAEKSLVNLLAELDYSRYEVDLFLFSKNGLFLPQVPEEVNILANSTDLLTFQLPLPSSLKLFLKKLQFKLTWARIMFFLINRFYGNKNIAEQKSWKYIAASILPLKENYTAAIGFLEKSSIYLVVDKVISQNKIGFIHTYYPKLKTDLQFDQTYFSALNKVLLVSKHCEIDFKTVFPEFASKSMVLHNINSPHLIRNLSVQLNPDLKSNAVISVGRLETVKGFDLAVEAAHILQQDKVDFHWYIIGDGNEKRSLEQQIATYHLENHFTFLGLKANPYPYIKNAKIFVQPSRYEGKSIAIDEAKILAKPIILTDFTTARDQVENGVTGIICEMSASSLAESIVKYFEEKHFTQKIIANLQSKDYGTEEEIEKFYQVLNA